MFTFQVTCTACKKTFEVDEHSKDYQKIKRDRKASYECPKCKAAIELEAKLAFGRALLRNS